MLFDSEKIDQFCLAYADEPDFTVPEIVRLARSPFLSGERAEIEQIFQSLPDAVQRDWRSRFVNTDHAVHKSTWFQIMLLSWFRTFSKVIPEPSILGHNPDFLLDIDGQKIVVEAKAVLISAATRTREIRKQEILWLLNRINEPSFVVHIKKVDLTSRINASRFYEQVTGWLNSAPETAFRYEDERGNHIELKTLQHRENGGVATIGPTGSFWIDSSKFQRPLRKKSHQHPAIRKSGYPYLIAIYLEDNVYSAEEIVEAWFGRQTVIVDTQTAKVVDQRLDMSGIHYFGNKIRHRSVSGTLVFHDAHNEREKRRRLHAWYIQNPYATKPVDPTLFPVEARFVVKSQTARHYQMDWKRGGGGDEAA